MPSIILASQSPQRKTLLAGLGVRFSVVHSTVDEDGHPELDPAPRSQILARLKAQDVAAKNPGDIVIGCDTLVVAANGELFEKPKDADDARRMVRAHSGATCTVHSALCVVDANGELHEGLSTSTVRFKPLTKEDVEWWIGTNLWQARSGAFQIDGPGQLLIEHIEGDWTGIVGLPVFLLGKLAREAKVDIVG